MPYDTIRYDTILYYTKTYYKTIYYTIRLMQDSARRWPCAAATCHSCRMPRALLRKSCSPTWDERYTNLRM